MKKLLKGLLAATMMLGLTACGGGEEEDVIKEWSVAYQSVKNEVCKPYTAFPSI